MSFLLLYIILPILTYFLYTRVISMYWTIYKYTCQKVPFHKGLVPFFGSYLSIQSFEKTYKPKNYPLVEWNTFHYGDSPPPFTGVVFATHVCLLVNSPEVMQELFLAKNKYYDKHEATGRIVKKVMGDSILFSRTTELWSHKRKALSASMYKEKLIKMTETMKAIALKTVADWTKKGTIDIVKETTTTTMRVLLACLFGPKNENPLVEQIYEGIKSWQPLGPSFQRALGDALGREFQLITILFIELMPFYFTKNDREIAYNAEKVRELVKALIQERRKVLANGEDHSANYEDLLTMLLQDELFQDNDDMLMDECIGLFVAGSQTTASVICNTLCYMIQNPAIERKLRDNLQDNLKAFGKSNSELVESLDMDAIDNLSYLKLCFYESLRIEPPVPISTSICLTEPHNIYGVAIEAGDMMLCNTYQLQHNQDEWIDHDKYIPERFEHESEYFLTPSGKQRNPMSFVPFSGGKRICIGKTFAETSFKFVMPILLNSFKFEYVNPEQLRDKPQVNIVIQHKPEIYLKLTRINKQ